MQSNGWLVHLTHVKTLQDSRTEFGFRSSVQELIKFDEKTVVRVLCLHDLHGARVPRATAAGFQVDTHFDLSFGYYRIDSG